MVVARLRAPADRAAQQKANEEHGVCEPHDRREQQEEDYLRDHARDEADAAAEAAPQRRPQQHVDNGRDLRREPHQQDEPEQKVSGTGPDEVMARARKGDRDRAEHQQSDPAGRAEEHQQREGELVAADPFQSRQRQKVPVLHVALAPAKIAVDELEQRRRILLEARAFLRQHAHLIPGAPHQHRFDLVVAQHVPGNERTLAEHREMAMGHERREPDDRVVTPVRPAVGLPPGAADGVGAHAEPHAELEDARKCAGRRHADDQALQDAELRIGLHDAHEAQHGLGGHQAVGVEHQRVVVLIAPAVAEVTDVAGLEAGVHFTPAVGERDAAAPGVGQLGEVPGLDGGDAQGRWCRSGHRHETAARRLAGPSRRSWERHAG